MQVFLLIIFISMNYYTFSHLDLEFDISKLISPNNKDINKKVEVLNHLGAIDQLLFDISLKNNISSSKLSNIANAFIEELEKRNDFKSIFYKIKTSDLLSFQKTLDSKRFALLNSRIVKEEQIKQGDFISKSLLKTKYKLLSHDGMAMQESLLKDPLHLGEMLVKSISEQNTGYNIKIINNMLFSQDENHLLIITKPKVKPFDIEGSQELMDFVNTQVDKIEKQYLDAKITILGGHLYSIQASNLIKSDLNLIILFSISGVLFIYWIFFRKIRLLLYSLIPVTIGFLTGLFFLIFLQKSVHGITLAFGSTLIGICIDYCAHYYSHYFLQDENSNLSAKDIMSTIKKSLLFAFLTTGSLFFIFYFSDFIFLKEIAIFTVTGLLAALLSVIYLLPELKVKKKKEIKSYNYITLFLKWLHLYFVKHFKILIIILILLIAPSIYLLKYLQFDEDLSKINYVSPSLKQTEIEFLNRFGDLSNSNLIVIQGKSFDTVLEFNDRVYEYLITEKENNKIDSFFNIHPFLPSKKKQIENLKYLKSINWQPIEEQVNELSQKMDFNPGAFKSFFNEIKNLSIESYPSLQFQDMKDSPFSPFLNEVLIQEKDRYILLSYFKTKDLNKNKQLIEKINSIDQNVFFMNQSDLISRIIILLKKELVFFYMSAVILVLITLSLLFKNLKKIFLTLFPVFFAILLTLLSLVILDVAVNIIALFSMVLLTGLGLDYGIFIINNHGKNNFYSSLYAIIISAWTTIFSFGILILSSNEALKSIGIVITLGMFYILVASIVILPVITKKVFK